MWKALHEAFDIEPLELGIEIAITDLLDGRRALEVHAEARSTGQTALVLTEEAFEYLTITNFDVVKQVRCNLVEYESTGDFVVRDSEVEAAIDGALDKLEAAAGRDPLRVLHRLDSDTLGDIEAGVEAELDPEWLAPDGPPALARRPGRSRVVRLATAPARAFLYLGYGGWNDCPAPAVQTRVWEHWAKTIGAAPTIIGGDSLTASVSTPIATRAALVQFACEAVAYDRDLIAEGWLPFLASLYRTSHIRFWWD